MQKILHRESGMVTYYCKSYDSYRILATYLETSLWKKDERLQGTQAGQEVWVPVSGEGP